MNSPLQGPMDDALVSSVYPNVCLTITSKEVMLLASQGSTNIVGRGRTTKKAIKNAASRIRAAAVPVPETAVCPKCKLPLNSDHAHRTYEEHDACRNGDWRTLSVTAIAAENSSVAEYVRQLEQQQQDLAMLVQRKGLSGSPIRMEEANG